MMQDERRRTEISLRDSRAFVAFSSESKFTQPVRTQFANGCPSPVDNLSKPSSVEKTYQSKRDEISERDGKRRDFGELTS